MGFPATVLARACSLIDRFGGPAAEAQFLDAVGDGPLRRFRVIDLLDVDVRRMTELVRQYADRRLGGTDASIVVIAERLGITTVATVNRRDFDNVRPAYIAALNIVP